MRCTKAHSRSNASTYSLHCSAKLHHIPLPHKNAFAVFLSHSLSPLHIHALTYHGGSGRTPSPGLGVFSFSGSPRPLLVAPSCARETASIPTCSHGDVERTSTAPSGRRYTCPCSCPCCLPTPTSFLGGGVFKELPGAPDSVENCCTEAKQSGRLPLAVLLPSFHVLLSCVLSCSNSLQTQSDSCLLSSLGVRCESTCDAKTVCVRVCVWLCMCVCDSSTVPACLSINLSCLVPVSLPLSLSIANTPYVGLFLPRSHSFTLSLSLS